MSNEARYMELVRELVLRFPKQEVSDASMAAYALDLADLPYDELRAVCRHLWRTEEWFPSIATIRKTWADQVMGPATSGEALRWATGQIGRIGGYRADGSFVEPRYPDPVVRETMKRFGWQRLARSANDSDWLDKEFSKVYGEARAWVAGQVMAGQLTPPSMALAERVDVPALQEAS